MDDYRKIRRTQERIKLDINYLLDILAKVDDTQTEADAKRARAINRLLSERRYVLARLERNDSAD